MEKLDVRERSAIQFFDDFLGIRSLNLVAVILRTTALPPVREGDRSSLDDVHLVSAGLGVELDPVDGRCASNKHQVVLFQMEKDPVADDIAVVAARNHCLARLTGKLAKLLIVR